MVWVKRLSWLVVGLLVLVFALLTYVAVFVNPNDFKDELKSVAMEKAGVNLRLDGDISWSFFPWLGLELEDIGVALGSDAEILQFDKAEFGLAIMPLLEQKIQVSKVNLVNLKASLRKDENGQGNWQLDLPEADSSSIPTTEANNTNNVANAVATDDASVENIEFTLPDLQLDELRIENAQVEYRDEQANQLINAALNVQLNDVRWDQAWPMVMDAAVTQSDLDGNLAIKASVKLNANLAVFPSRESLSLDSLVLSGEVESDTLPVSPIKAKLSAAKVDFDLPQENALIEGLALSALGLNIDADIQAYEVLSEPKFSVSLSLGDFNPREVMAALNLSAPEMSDDKAFTSARASIALEGDLKSITAQPISIVLDDTKIEANAVLNLSPLSWDVRIAGANLNLDRYLPTPPEETEVTPEVTSEAVSSAAVTEEASDLIPVELIRGLNGHIGIAFEDIIIKNLKIDKIELDSTQANGLVKVSPLKASLYEGNVASTVSLDVRGNTPLINVVPSIDGIQIQPLLIDFMEMDKISGATYLNGELSTKGNQVDDLMASLQGDLLVDIRNGALVGTNLTKSVCEGIAYTQKDNVDGSKFGEDTPFETMKFPARIVNGQVSTPGLDISSAGIQVTGDGVVSLTESSLDYQVNVGFPGSALDDACLVNEKVAKLTFPIICQGQFSDDPAGLCRPDLKGFGSLFVDLAKAELKLKADEEKAKLKAELDAKVAAEKAKLKAELEAKLKAEEDALKDKLKNKLKDLF
ncbi:membrane assembly protein AsmA [Marinomonas ushuaiensis DSM 15871]|uniref:Membrane assembly protein AsmA n=1 Tax=Marinomonas ushuaiensis DSM 15871 TaxID=1122207 RepID=X7E9D1_9GAMM|nr:AsmA family protein [Marinomonas ushuaiensis]ETX12547.1 membrane assembly protein AsmA [Marinomonas ushuaiensis DSM 15871]